MRTKRSLAFTNLSVEVLEQRCLLTAAVGSFNRNDTANVAASAGAGVYIGGNVAVWDQRGPGDSSTYYDTGNVVAIASTSDPDVFGFGEQRAYAASRTAPNSATAVPHVFSWVFDKTNVRDGAIVADGTGPGFSTGGASAGGIFSYNVDPLFENDLFYHGHLFIATNHDAIVSGNATIKPGSLFAHLWAPAATAGADYNEASGLWDWTFALDGQTTLSGTSFEGVNRHFHYTIAYDSLNPNGVQFLSITDAEMHATSYSDSSAVSLTRAFGATWGYVTVGSADVTAGDFNYDGTVNQTDFALWQELSPQADANFDAVIDYQDYSIWADSAAAQENAILVTTTADVTSPNDGVTSLREAVALAADANHPGHSIIAFSDAVIAAGTINLQSTLVIGNTNEVSILGPGAENLTIHRNNGSILLQVNGGGPAEIESTIAGLKLTGTNATGTGVLHTDTNNRHHLVLNHVQIVANGYGVWGPANGQLNIVDSLIANNSRHGIVGGASSYIAGAKLTVIDSVIRDNGWNGIDAYSVDTSISGTEISGNNAATGSATRSGLVFGADEYEPNLEFTIANSTIAETKNNGRGITLNPNATTTIVNSTISSNTGIGIVVTGANATLINATVSNNMAQPSQTGNVRVGGIYAGSGSIVTLKNTIVAENKSGLTAPNPIYADLAKHSGGSFNLVASAYNLIGAIVGSVDISADPGMHNIFLGSNAAGLMALSDYGGRTRTHALLASTLAIDNGNDEYWQDEAFTELYGDDDQRGPEFDRIVGLHVDIGALEVAVSEYYD